MAPIVAPVAAADAVGDRADGVVIVRGDVLDRQRVQPVGAAMAAAEMIIGDDDVTARDMMLSLAVIGMAIETQIVITARITAAGRGEDHAVTRDRRVRQEGGHRNPARSVRAGRQRQFDPAQSSLPSLFRRISGQPGRRYKPVHPPRAKGSHL